MGLIDVPISLLAYQFEAVNNPARFAWHCWARQTGKSFTLCLRRILRGLLRKRNQIILSAGQRQSREVMEKVRSHCAALRIWSELEDRGYFKGTMLRRIELALPAGVRVIGLPANPLTARGYSGDVFLDEFAMHRDDEAIWSALFPTVLRNDGELDVASTPRGCRNVFSRLRENEAFDRRTMTLEAAVAGGLEVDIAALRRALGDELAWRQEFCCEFADETTSFMPYELIRRCHEPSLSTAVDWERLAHRRLEVYAGVDVGRFRDLTAVWLWERIGEAFWTRGVVVLEAAPFAEQEAVIARVLEQRAVRRCCIDSTGLGLHLAERLAERFGEHRVEKVTFTTALKSELAGALRVAAERGILRIPPDDAIASDWHATRRIVTPSGQVRYDADPSAGGHADRFWAAALGFSAAQDPTGPVEFMSGGAMAFARRGAW